MPTDVPTLDLQRTSTFLSQMGERALMFLPQAVTAILILAAGLFLAGWLARLLGRVFERSTRIGATVRAPLISIVRYIVVIFTVIVALGQVGVQMTSLLAVLGAAGLAVGLALQGTLTNIAAGIMLLWLRPFRVGDYIETATFSGTVCEIGLFVCHIETFDGIFVFAPNSAIWNVWLKNHTRAGPRTLAWSVSLGRDVPITDANGVLVAPWPTNAGATHLSGPTAFLDQLTADAQVIVLRGTVAGGSIAAVQREVPEEIRRRLIARFGEAGEPKALQRLVPGDADPSRYLTDAAAPRANAKIENVRPEAADQGAVATPAR